MRTLGLLLFLFMVSEVTFAETFAQTTALQMSNILAATPVQQLLEQKTIINLNSITYKYTGRSANGPAIFELELLVNDTKMGIQSCKAHARVNIQDNSFMELSQPMCK